MFILKVSIRALHFDFGKIYASFSIYALVFAFRGVKKKYLVASRW